MPWVTRDDWLPVGLSAQPVDLDQPRWGLIEIDTLTSHGSIYAKAGSGTSEGTADRSSGASERAAGSGSGKCGCGGRPSADITIVQHLSAEGTEAFAEVGGGGVIPQSVLEEHFCNARIKGVVFSGPRACRCGTATPSGSPRRPR